MKFSKIFHILWKTFWRIPSNNPRYIRNLIISFSHEKIAVLFCQNLSVLIGTYSLNHKIIYIKSPLSHTHLYFWFYDCSIRQHSQPRSNFAQWWKNKGEQYEMAEVTDGIETLNLKNKDCEHHNKAWRETGSFRIK